LICRLPLFTFSGGFSETYAALCDYNGIGCKEEVQWVRSTETLPFGVYDALGFCTISDN